jgi:hypothetical protein
MYIPELMEWFSKHKKQLKSLCSIMESLLNQSHNKCSQDTIYMEICEESISFIFFTYPPTYTSRDGSKVRIVHALMKLAQSLAIHTF